MRRKCETILKDAPRNNFPMIVKKCAGSAGVRHISSRKNARRTEIPVETILSFGLILSDFITPHLNFSINAENLHNNE